MSQPQKTLHICIAFDDNYVQPFYVLLTSIFINNKSSNIVIHSITSGIDEQEKNKISKYVSANQAKIHFYEIHSSLLQNFPIPKETYITLAGYYRLFFPLIVPRQVARIVYLDTDTLVVGDLGDLYNIQPVNPIAAVVDAEMPFRADLELENKDSYFNSGVLVIFIDQWISQNITEKASSFITENRADLLYPDQDALNYAVRKNWQKLDPRFNVMPFDIPPSSDDAPDAFLEGKVVIHYAGNYKPWGIGRPKLKKVYKDYHDRFLRTEIGKTFSPSRLETEVMEIIQEFDQDFIFLAFYLHLLWIKKIREHLPQHILTELLKKYYYFDHADSASPVYQQRLAVYQENSETITDLFSNVMYNTPSSLSTLTRCRSEWVNLCDRELQKVKVNGVNTDNLQPLIKIPQLVNEKLMINGDIRSLLFFSINKVFEPAN